MSNPIVVDLPGVRRILGKLNFPAVDLQSDEQLASWVFRPTEAVTTNEILATALSEDDALSPAERLTLAHFVIAEASDMPGFKALVAAANLTVLLIMAVGKWVGCAAGNHQLSNVFMATDTAGLIPLAQYAAARSRSHLSDDETTQDLCTRAADQLAARYGD